MIYVAVVGPGDSAPEAAEPVGRLVAERGAVLVCGGLGGSMEAACRGAKEAGGATLGVLPGVDRGEANPYVDISVPTGLGQGRNVVIVHAADALIAVGGGYGTLSEIALALRAGKPVIGVGSWEVEGVVAADTPEAAVAAAFDALSS